MGFDWPDLVGVVAKIDEELKEVKDELPTNGEEATRALEAEVGDLLFSVVNLARKLGVDPEAALEGTNVKFEDRFAVMERELLARGNSLKDASLEEMERGWAHAKSLPSEG